MVTKLSEFLKTENIEYIENAKMSEYTSFRVGGSAKMLILPKNTEELLSVISSLKDDDNYMIIGAGSNILFADSGFDGIIVRLCDNFKTLSVENDVITASAGTRLSVLTSFALKNRLTGLEFAGGIPGTVGGGLYMNAGAYGGEMKDCLFSADVITKDGKIKTIPVNECELSYRNSIFKKENLIVLSAKFKLNKANAEELETAYARLNELNRRRRDSQPLEYPSAGSTFKRPVGYYAAALIEECGLKGFRVGGATVSQKHAGFVINDMNASSKEIYTLIKCVQKIVKDKKDVELEPEVILAGDFDA